MPLLVAIIVLAVMVLVQSYSMPAAVLEPLGPAAFPFFLSIGLIVGCAVALADHVWQARRSTVRPDDVPEEKEALQRSSGAFGGLIYAAAATVIYLATLQFLDIRFALATAAYLFAVSAYFSPKKAVELAIVAAASLLFGFVVEYLFTHVLFIDIAG